MKGEFKKRKEEIFTLLAVLPMFLLVLLGGWFYWNWNTLLLLENEASGLQKQLIVYFQKKARTDSLCKKIKESSPNYLQTKTSEFSFLKSEKEELRPLVDLFPQDEELLSRLSFLEGDQNRLLLKKKSERKEKELLEIEWEQEFPVQIEVADLKTLFTIPTAPKATQLFFQKISLKRALSPLGKPHYLFSSTLVERKYAHLP